jgi:hypothetical protein
MRARWAGQGKSAALSEGRRWNENPRFRGDPRRNCWPLADAERLHGNRLSSVEGRVTVRSWGFKSPLAHLIATGVQHPVYSSFATSPPLPLRRRSCVRDTILTPVGVVTPRSCGSVAVSGCSSVSEEDRRALRCKAAAVAAPRTPRAARGPALPRRQIPAHRVRGATGWFRCSTMAIPGADGRSRQPMGAKTRNDVSRLHCSDPFGWHRGAGSPVDS